MIKPPQIGDLPLRASERQLMQTPLHARASSAPGGDGGRRITIICTVPTTAHSGKRSSHAKSTGTPKKLNSPRHTLGLVA